MPRPRTIGTMTQAEIQAAITECGGLANTAEKIGVPRRTLQDWARGVSGIPEESARKLIAYRDDWREWWIVWRDGLAARIDAEFGGNNQEVT